MGENEVDGSPKPRLPPGTTILQVTPALDAGGVEQTTLDMARAIVEAGGRALVASAGGRLEGELKARGGELVRLPLDRKDPASLGRSARALRRLIRREGVQVVHARSRAPAYPALWAARAEGAAFVTTYHGIYNARSPLKRWYNRVMARGDVVIANSEFTRDHLLAEHRRVDPDKVVAVARGIDVRRFDPAMVYAGRVAQVRADWGLDPDDRRPVALMAGRLTAWKGQALLIEAARRLREVDRDPFHLILAGDDQGRHDYTDSLRQQIEAAGLEDVVRIVGHVSDMPAAYLACTVACAPSLEPEAFGRTAVEPQAMGRPVIAADHGATSETVEQGVTGWRVAPGDADAWAAAMGAALTLRPAKRAEMGEAGRARVLKLYSLEAMTTATLRVYDRVLTSRQARIDAAAKPERILVIKLAALGDVVQAFPPFAHIRQAHPRAHITLLTTPPYAALAAASPYFDAIETDGRPKRSGDTAAMLKRLRRAHYDRVYDLQTSTRSSAYYLALWPRPPQWSGIAPLASHPHVERGRDRMHTLERQADQLKDAGVWPDAPIARGTAPAPDLSFMLVDETPERRPEHFGLTGPYAVLIPGASAHRPGKRWPADAYAALALRLIGQGLEVVVIGGPAEADIGALIVELAGDGVFDLTGATDYAQIAGLAARARLAVGNDTGPTHLAAATGVPTLVLFSGESDPELCAPRGRRVELLQSPRLADLSLDTVVETVGRLLAEP